jgi:choline dehydrogenase-like flavoprotein
MPFAMQRDGYMLSPYLDYLSFFFNRDWKFPAGDILGVMVKLADTNQGSIARGELKKRLTEQDRARLSEGVALCKEMLRRFGADEERMFLGTINAGHPGGMLPLTEREAGSLHHERLPANLYVADATLLPRALGNPPILTIIALAKRVSRLCGEMHG